MKYEIIELSQSHADYRNEIPDSGWIGEIPGVVNGWQFEYVNDEGRFDYSSVSYEYGMPEDYASRWHTADGIEWIHETPMWNGWKPTGRVVFRGYGLEYYDFEERETFIEPYDPVVERSYII